MKHTKKLLAAVMAVTMVSALAPMSAFAEDTEIKENTATQAGTMTAIYEVSAKYTVTIPAGVTLSDTETVTKDITAENVLLESGKVITVKLTSGTNTTSGSTFSAKNEAGTSTASYTISAGGSAISVGGTVATFNTGTAKQTVAPPAKRMSKSEEFAAAGRNHERTPGEMEKLLADLDKI